MAFSQVYSSASAHQAAATQLPDALSASPEVDGGGQTQVTCPAGSATEFEGRGSGLTGETPVLPMHSPSDISSGSISPAAIGSDATALVASAAAAMNDHQPGASKDGGTISQNTASSHHAGGRLPEFLRQVGLQVWG